MYIEIMRKDCVQYWHTPVSNAAAFKWSAPLSAHLTQLSQRAQLEQAQPSALWGISWGHLSFPRQTVSACRSWPTRQQRPCWLGTRSYRQSCSAVSQLRSRGKLQQTRGRDSLRASLLNTTCCSLDAFFMPTQKYQRVCWIYTLYVAGWHLSFVEFFVKVQLHRLDCCDFIIPLLQICYTVLLWKLLFAI